MGPHVKTNLRTPWNSGREIRFVKPTIVIDIDNVNKDKSPFSSGEGGFRGMGLVLKSMASRIITHQPSHTPFSTET